MLDVFFSRLDRQDCVHRREGKHWSIKDLPAVTGLPSFTDLYEVERLWHTYPNDSQDHVNRVCKAPKQLRQRKADRRARLPHLKPNLGRHVLRSSSEGQVKKPDSVLVSPTLSHSSLKGGGCEHQSSVGGKTKHVPRTGSHPSEFSSPMQERRREG